MRVTHYDRMQFSKDFVYAEAEQILLKSKPRQLENVWWEWLTTSRETGTVEQGNGKAWKRIFSSDLWS